MTDNRYAARGFTEDGISSRARNTFRSQLQCVYWRHHNFAGAASSRERLILPLPSWERRPRREFLILLVPGFYGLEQQRQRQNIRLFRSRTSYSLMQQYPRVLHVPSALATKWQDMQTPLFSRTSTPEISVTRLHSVLVISRHMVRSCLA